VAPKLPDAKKDENAPARAAVAAAGSTLSQTPEGGSFSAANPLLVTCSSDFAFSKRRGASNQRGEDKERNEEGKENNGSGESKLPAGNALFPELVAAIFRLEKAIVPAGRPASTMVAVNRRAAFAPHTDAGAGLGQSTSLLVGLGDYTGGELAVEGAVHEARYQPVEFDGWRERHWTLPFEGERFSLVWFSPALSQRP